MVPNTIFESHWNEYTISTEKSRLDIELIFHYLHHEAYWSLGIPREVVERSIQNALCFGIYHGDKQVGFSRVITDFATFGYLGDVFVVPAYRGRGLSKWMMECVTSHPGLKGLRRFHLVTADAHGLYRQYGFIPVANPEKHMEKVIPATELYRSS